MKNKNLLIILGAFVFSIILGYTMQIVNARNLEFGELDTSVAVFQQDIILTSDTPVEITKLYRSDQLIGIVTDETKLSSLIEEVYNRDYAQEFPDSKLGLMDDVYEIKELSYHQYEDIDDEIFKYIENEDLFSVDVPRISFSNGAVIYVKELQDFKNAQEKFILNFISRDTYNILRSDEKLPLMSGYGTRDISFKVEEDITISRGLASKDNILMNEDEIQMFLNYGYNPKMQTYQVQEYDTVSTISFASGMNPRQLMILNPEITDKDQILEVGSTLNVTYYNSPLSVFVEKERKVSEPVIADEAIIVEDNTLAEGTTVVDTAEKSGKADVTYVDTYINGENSKSVQTSYTVVEEPVREVLRVGTYVEPRVGNGDFRWPIVNGWKNYGFGEYPGHRGTDFLPNSGQSGDNIYPIDRGVVTEVAYGGALGNYVRINHNNGYESVYAHMVSFPPVSVGDVVSKNSVIGYVGSTGYSTANHVHLQVDYYGTTIDACTILGC